MFSVAPFSYSISPYKMLSLLKTYDGSTEANFHHSYGRGGGNSMPAQTDFTVLSQFFHCLRLEVSASVMELTLIPKQLSMFGMR